jgi:poly(A) polymerase
VREGNSPPKRRRTRSPSASSSEPERKRPKDDLTDLPLFRPSRPPPAEGPLVATEVVPWTPSQGTGFEPRERKRARDEEPRDRPVAREHREQGPRDGGNKDGGPRDRDRPRKDRRDRDRDAGDERETKKSDVDLRFAVGPRPRVIPRALPVEHIDEDAAKVIKRLTRAGHIAYLVGGGVRDLLLGRKPKDFDVATSARPHEVRDLFRNCRIIGRRFRLAHILFGSRKVIETATFRKDPGGDGAEHEGPEVTGSGEGDAEDAFSPLTPRAKSRDESADILIRHDNVFGDPHEDAIRRDFTINGLFYDIERGEVIDYVGGMSDIEARVMRTIGLPDVRFREDPVRILRAIKFAARCDLGIDPEVYDAMVAQRDELKKSAKPRLFEEILRLLRGGAGHRSIWLAWETGILSVILPELAGFLDDAGPDAPLVWGRLHALDQRIVRGEQVSDAVLITALLLGVIDDVLDGEPNPAVAYEDLMDSISDELAVPRRMKDRVRILWGCQNRLRTGRVGSMARREFFIEAAEVNAIDCEARGVAVHPGVLSADASAPEGSPESEGPRRRRRRRR